MNGLHFMNCIFLYQQRRRCQISYEFWRIPFLSLSKPEISEVLLKSIVGKTATGPPSPWASSGMLPPGWVSCWLLSGSCSPLSPHWQPPPRQTEPPPEPLLLPRLSCSSTFKNGCDTIGFISKNYENYCWAFSFFLK